MKIHHLKWQLGIIFTMCAILYGLRWVGFDYEILVILPVLLLSFTAMWRWNALPIWIFCFLAYVGWTMSQNFTGRGWNDYFRSKIHLKGEPWDRATLDRARGNFRIAAWAYPLNTTAQIELGWCHFFLGNLGEAKRIFQRVDRFFSDQYFAQFGVALCDLHSGDDSARERIEQFRSMNTADLEFDPEWFMSRGLDLVE